MVAKSDVAAPRANATDWRFGAIWARENAPTVRGVAHQQFDKTVRRGSVLRMEKNTGTSYRSVNSSFTTARDAPLTISPEVARF